MLTLRRARPDDEAQLLEWRNEPTTRRASFTSTEISPLEHHRWFTSKLEDPGCLLLIVEEDGVSIGQVRLDRVGPDVAEISIGLAPEARGRRLGRESLRISIAEASRRLGIEVILAHVKRGNTASLSAFGAAGFSVVGEDGDSLELSHRIVADSAS